MADPSKPDDQKTAEGLEALHELLPPPDPPKPTLGQVLGELQRTEDKSKVSAQSDISTVPTVPAEPDTLTSPTSPAWSVL